MYTLFACLNETAATRIIHSGPFAFYSSLSFSSKKFHCAHKNELLFLFIHNETEGRGGEEDGGRVTRREGQRSFHHKRISDDEEKTIEG